MCRLTTSVVDNYSTDICSVYVYVCVWYVCLVCVCVCLHACMCVVHACVWVCDVFCVLNTEFVDVFVIHPLFVL